MMIGTRVLWKTLTKDGQGKNNVGEIINIIAPNLDPTYIITVMKGVHKATSRLGGFQSRQHQSYLVLVQGEGKKKPVIHWPTASRLIVMDVQIEDKNG